MNRYFNIAMLSVFALCSSIPVHGMFNRFTSKLGFRALLRTGALATATSAYGLTLARAKSEETKDIEINKKIKPLLGHLVLAQTWEPDHLKYIDFYRCNTESCNLISEGDVQRLAREDIQDAADDNYVYGSFYTKKKRQGESNYSDIGAIAFGTKDEDIIDGLHFAQMRAVVSATKEQNSNKKTEKPNYVDISGIDKVALIKALFYNAKPLGMGFLHYDAKHSLSDDEAENLVRSGTDYVKGRVMKINVSDDTVYTRLYNRDNGPGAAEKVIERLRSQKSN